MRALQRANQADVRPDLPFDLLIEEMNDGAAIISPSGTVLYVNRRMAELVRSPIEAIVGTSFERFVSPADAARLRVVLRDTQAARCAGEVAALAADGSVVPLQLTIVTVTWLATPLICAIASDISETKARERELQLAHDELESRVAELARINADLLHSRAAALNMMEDAVEARLALERTNEELRREISHRQEAQAALARSEERYREMFMSDMTGAYVSSSDGMILDANPAFLSMFGFASLEEAQRTPFERYFARVQDRIELITAICERGRVDYRELEYRRTNGNPLHVIESAVGVFAADGTLKELRGYIVDTTARKELENQFRHAQKMEAIGKLAGGIAHDFNNVLCAILGYSELVLDRVQDDPIVVADMEEIRTAGQRASRLTQQLLAFSRKTLAMPKDINLNDVVTGVEKMLARLIGEDVRLVLNIEPQLGTIKADPGQIEQVVMNLAVNARDAMPRGGVLTITTANVTLDSQFVRQHVGSSEGPFVAITISDTGHGMMPEILDHIFEPFFTTKAAGKGTGLGLSTVYGIVKQSNGYVTVDSTLGVGTTFTIYLPRITSVSQSLKPAAPRNQAPRGHETVLVVEDEAFVGDLIRKVLEPAGYRVLLARRAAEALLIAQHEPEPIALLLTDVVMPDLHGPELAQHVRRLRPELKVLYVSGFVDHAAVDLGELRRDAEFLAKPFTSDALLSKVRERLDRPATTPHDVAH